MIYEFGDFQLNTKERQLRRLAGDLIPLPPKAFELLCVFVENNGRLLTKTELMDRVWADSFVEEGNLKINVHTLRKILNEGFVETVPKHGYRFTGEVKRIETPTAAAEAPEESLPAKPRRRQVRAIWLTGAGVVFCALLAAGLSNLWKPVADNPSLTVNTLFKPAKTIAVLPFKNLTKDTQDKFLGIGLADSLITKLGSVSRISVRPTSAVLAFDEGADPTVISERLQVESILEGTIQRIGRRLRISVQLVQMPQNQVLWASSFEENERDLLKIQESISVQIVKSLEVNLDQDERALFARNETSSYEAFQLYLRGRYAWNKRTAAELQESIRLFKAAIDRDPVFTQAYTGLADSYALLSEYYVAPPAETFPKAKIAAQKALEINPNSAEAHTTLAYVLAGYDWSFAEAETEYLKAIELNPNYPTARQWYSEFLTGLKRFDEAEAQITRARELDPLSPIIQTDIGLLHYYKHEYDAASRELRKTASDNPDFPLARYGLAIVYERQGNLDDAFAEELKAWQLYGADENTIRALTQARREGGHRGFLSGQIAIHDELAKVHYNPAFSQAFLYARLGDRENTLKYLDRSVDERYRYSLYINVEPAFEPFHGDPQFRDLLKRIGLP